MQPADFIHQGIHTLYELNRSSLSRRTSCAEFLNAANALFKELPDAYHLSVQDAERFLVCLGNWGSSLLLSHQQQYPEVIKTNPGQALQSVRVGAEAISFPDYFRNIIARTNIAHPPRDAYASLVRWNTPEYSVYWQGTRLATLPSVFDDGQVRTYTDDVGETLILELFKQCETYEKAANDVLSPIWQGSVTEPEEMRERIEAGVCCLLAVRDLMIRFPKGDRRGKLTVDHFIDVFRQFAVHWQVKDIPPSGPQDIEFIKRDLMLGIDFEGYNSGIRRIFPGLLAQECTTISTLFHRETLTERIFGLYGLTAEQLSAMTFDDLMRTLHRHPVVLSLYGLLEANARLSASHLALTKHYLFKPIGTTAKETLRAQAVVPNERGITDMTNSMLERLHEGRRSHPLRFLAPAFGYLVEKPEQDNFPLRYLNRHVSHSQAALA